MHPSSGCQPRYSGGGASSSFQRNVTPGFPDSVSSFNNGLLDTPSQSLAPGRHRASANITVTSLVTNIGSRAAGSAKMTSVSRAANSFCLCQSRTPVPDEAAPCSRSARTRCLARYPRAARWIVNAAASMRLESSELAGVPPVGLTVMGSGGLEVTGSSARPSSCTQRRSKGSSMKTLSRAKRTFLIATRAPNATPVSCTSSIESARDTSPRSSRSCEIRASLRFTSWSRSSSPAAAPVPGT
mmetsp:Transcript_74836/g.208071  ORF Transcript_74836/g.208071 Transcript_74836/m.208071 type:complete len:242 (+) Transcript_74836:1352-2077(+)